MSLAIMAEAFAAGAIDLPAFRTRWRGGFPTAVTLQRSIMNRRMVA
jgi:hypothetical protein